MRTHVFPPTPFGGALSLNHEGRAVIQSCSCPGKATLGVGAVWIDRSSPRGATSGLHERDWLLTSEMARHHPYPLLAGLICVRHAAQARNIKATYSRTSRSAP